MSKDTRGHKFNEHALEYHLRLRRVREHLESDITKALSADEAATIAGLSVNYFSTYFRSRVGLRFGEWQRMVRIESALRHLQTSDYPITRVAALVGYASLRSFERAFKQTTGTTPVEYRRLVLQR
ncbi:MAG: helix-turn-helix transcriptional regulator [bacterium]|nr:helix-turn-helix transcriptional regulator [bacterium]